MRTRRTAFTLFELILAVALAATLLALIGTAINLYLMRVDTDRTRVEEAQLARSILAMITDDIREASVYQKQDTSAIAQLMAASKPFDVDSIDNPREGTTSTGKPGGTNAATKIAALSSSSGATAGSSGSSAGSSSSGAPNSAASNDESDDTMPLGLSGTLDELYVDVTRLPRQEELFNTVTGYTNALSPSTKNPSATSASTVSGALNPPADLKTVHYFIRPGDAVEPGSAAVTSLAPDAKASAGGLVRQEISRRVRVFAEQNGNSSLTDSGAVLVAPEVVRMQFQYYDGSQLTDTWDMKQLKKLPIAIQVGIWLRSAKAGSPTAAGDHSADALNSARAYRQIVYLPMSQVSESNAASGASDSSASSATGSSTASGSSSSSSDSAFGEQ